jgi:hypothetical protein
MAVRYMVVAPRYVVISKQGGRTRAFGVYNTFIRAEMDARDIKGQVVTLESTMLASRHSSTKGGDAA